MDAAVEAPRFNDRGAQRKSNDGMQSSDNVLANPALIIDPSMPKVAHLKPRLQAAVREVLARDLLRSLSRHQTTDFSKTSSTTATTLQRRHARYMLIMGAIVGEFLKSTHQELTLSVFMKELEFYFATNVLVSSVPVHDKQQHFDNDSSPWYAELTRAMSVLGLIELIGIAPYSKFGRQLQRNFYRTERNVSDGEDISRANQHATGTSESTYRASTGSFLFQLLRSVETSGMFDAQTETAVQVCLLNSYQPAAVHAGDDMSVLSDAATSTAPLNAGVPAAEEPNYDRYAVRTSDVETQQLLEELDRDILVHAQRTAVPPRGDGRFLSDAQSTNRDSLKTRRHYIVLKLKRLLQQQYDRELHSQLERLRTDEMSRMRRELEEHYRTQFLQSQLALERDYKQRCNEVAERERQLSEQFSQRQSEFEHEEHIKRTKLLLEAEKLVERERDLEHRHQLRRDELEDANSRLVALQVEIEQQSAALKKRERKLNEFQSVFEDAERERRQQFEAELEQQRKIFADEERRLRRFIEEVVARDDALARENEQLRAHIRSTSGEERAPTEAAGSRSRKMHQLEQNLTSPSKPVRKEYVGTTSRHDPLHPEALDNDDVAASSAEVDKVRSKLWRLNQRYVTLKQRYTALTGRGERRNAEQQQTSESDAHHNANLHSRRRQYDGQQRKKSPHDRAMHASKQQNGRLDAGVSAAATLHLLDNITKHFKAQDALKHELAHEIDRGIERLAVAGSSSVMITPNEASLNAAEQQMPFRNNFENCVIGDNVPAFTVPINTAGINAVPPQYRPQAAAIMNVDLFRRQQLLDLYYDHRRESHEKVSAADTNAADRNNNILSTETELRDLRVISSGKPAQKNSNNPANLLLHVADFRASHAADDASTEQIYEMRRLEKRLEQSMRLLAAGDEGHEPRRYPKPNSHNRSRAGNNEPPRRSPTAPPVAPKSDACVAATNTQTVRQQSSDLEEVLAAGYSGPTIFSREFEDVELRQLTAERHKLDDYMFRPLPPLLDVVMSRAKPASVIEYAVKAVGDSEQQQKVSVDVAPATFVTGSEPLSRQSMAVMPSKLPGSYADKAGDSGSLSHANEPLRKNMPIESSNPPESFRHENASVNDTMTETSDRTADSDSDVRQGLNNGFIASGDDDTNYMSLIQQMRAAATNSASSSSREMHVDNDNRSRDIPAAPRSEIIVDQTRAVQSAVGTLRSAADDWFSQIRQQRVVVQQQPPEKQEDIEVQNMLQRNASGRSSGGADDATRQPATTANTYSSVAETVLYDKKPAEVNRKASAEYNVSEADEEDAW